MRMSDNMEGTSTCRELEEKGRHENEESMKVKELSVVGRSRLGAKMNAYK